MTKNRNLRQQAQSIITNKRFLILSSILLISVALLATCYSGISFAANSNLNINVAKNSTQFSPKIVYAYVGQDLDDTSYTARNGAQMHRQTDYPSSIRLNITRLPGNQITTCDAEIEIYDVKVETDTGLIENNPYFVGTNYNMSFTSSQLSTLFAHASDLTQPENFSTHLRGDFIFNSTDNKSILSIPIGSVGYYSNRTNTLNLWSAGKPNTISITVQRIGYITITGNVITLYKDQSNTPPAAVTQLGHYNKDFIHNDLIPPAQLPDIDRFNPVD